MLAASGITSLPQTIVLSLRPEATRWVASAKSVPSSHWNTTVSKGRIAATA